jgi:hypothetical protein
MFMDISYEFWLQILGIAIITVIGAFAFVWWDEPYGSSEALRRFIRRFFHHG